MCFIHQISQPLLISQSAKLAEPFNMMHAIYIAVELPHEPSFQFGKRWAYLFLAKDNLHQCLSNSILNVEWADLITTQIPRRALQSLESWAFYGNVSGEWPWYKTTVVCGTICLTGCLITGPQWTLWIPINSGGAREHAMRVQAACRCWWSNDLKMLQFCGSATERQLHYVQPSRASVMDERYRRGGIKIRWIHLNRYGCI